MKMHSIQLGCLVGICMGILIFSSLVTKNYQTVEGTHNLDGNQTLSYSGNATGQIGFGETVEGTIDHPRKIDIYEFKADEGDTIIIRASSYSGDLFAGVRLRDSTNNILQEARSPNTAEMHLTLDHSGMHKIELFDGFDGTKTGDYCLYLERINNPGSTIYMDFGQVLDGFISKPAQMQLYAFPAIGEGCSVIRMNCTSVDMWPGIQLYDPDGYLIAESRSFDTAEIRITFLKAGDYVALAYDEWDGTRTGSFRIGLFMDTPGDANGDKVINGRDLIASKMTMLDMIESLMVPPGVDSNGDGSVDGLDLIAIRKIILNV